MAREAWPNVLNAQLFNSKVVVYFRGGLFPWGFISVGVYFLSKMKWVFFSVGVSLRNRLMLARNITELTGVCFSNVFMLRCSLILIRY